MSDPKMQLVDWLDDLCVRFIINLPHEELLSVERICFQIEEAQWFYEDFIRPLDPSLPSMNLRRFSLLMFQHCPLSSNYSELHHTQAYEDFLAYKTRVPVRGAIMLNEDMSQAVLVKGWKKGAKWSFPRGKINKDEPDLDCAVREVYEETGYDLKGAGLVKPEEDMKKIAVSMREQNMQLYVFRGVPMDTHFEPRTRKEISKIDWYKLTDLPTIRKKHQVQQGTGNDLIKDNSFYMVAPFLAPLKHWIKQQRRLDRQNKTSSGQYLVPPNVDDLELAEEDIQGETTADEGLAAEILPGNEQAADGSFADLVARLGRSHRTSDALPEVSMQPQTAEVFDPAAELKRLLSVDAGLPSQAAPVEAPAAAQQPQANQLLSFFQGSKPTQSQPPRTPYDQIMPPPPLPQSPHGQHHPRPPHLENMPPPPQYGFQPQHPPSFRSPQPPHMQPQHLNGRPLSIPRNFIPPPPQQNPVFHSHGPSIQEAFSQQAARPYQRTGDPQFAQAPQFPGLHGPAIPPASRLPPPKLTEHALGLLNAFKSQEKPTPTPQQNAPQPQHGTKATPKTQPPALQSAFDSYISPSTLPSANPYAPSPPPFQSPPSVNLQTAQPKPRNAHQDSLLNLFRSPSVSAATPPPQMLGVGPVELSAQPTTPGHSRLPSAVRATGPPRPDLTIKPDLPDPFGQHPKKPEITSATVSGPVNVPDFDTVKKHSHIHDANGHGHSRGPSPAGGRSTEQMPFPPMQILKRNGPPSIATIEPSQSQEVTRSRSPRARTPKIASNETTPLATNFKPTILRRPQQTQAPIPSPTLQPSTAAPAKPTPHAHFSAAPTVQTAFDRREAQAPDQKSTLLSLFGKPSQISTSPLPTSASPIPPQPLYNPPPGIPSLPSKSPLPRSPIPPARSPHPQPPTPKSIVSGIISPVSPLPADKNSAAGSPAHLASRSRISSIGEEMQSQIPGGGAKQIPTSHPAPLKNGAELAGAGFVNAGENGNRGGKTGETKSPVDKTFLLGLLGDMARKGR
ncbi:hypothetical protein BDV96DRAFT_582078 [Lophiotrema nucula]|uniref:Nudix hydrolase domain-containing protein n=1 Tax=Lophiotrema nucula TaxID=690887 RepID=A0A6A5YZ34_9PLEO|nr:hypothetical protein BDV96DRAFT_582078 [Lophiotrema nucula]